MKSTLNSCLKTSMMAFRISKEPSLKLTKDGAVGKGPDSNLPDIRETMRCSLTDQLDDCLKELSESAYELGHRIRTAVVEEGDAIGADLLYAALHSQAKPIHIIRRAIELLERKAESHPPVHWFSSSLLIECFQQQVAIEPETIHYGIGNRCGQIQVLERVISAELDSSSVGHASANDRFSHKLLASVEERGSLLTSHFHTHPGRGESSTLPSNTDYVYQQKLEDGGYRTIGCIYSRDGYLRFFANLLEFRVIVTGKGVDHVRENLYKITASR